MGRCVQSRHVNYPLTHAAYVVASASSMAMEYFSDACRLPMLMPIYVSGILLMLALCGGCVSKRFGASLLVRIGVICNGMVFLLQLFPPVY